MRPCIIGVFYDEAGASQENSMIIHKILLFYFINAPTGAGGEWEVLESGKVENPVFNFSIFSTPDKRGG